jgi:hypothetical protein
MPNNKAMSVEEVDRFFAIETNNGTWSLIEKDDRSPADDVEMIHQAHASCFHWSRVGEPVNVVRAHYLVAKAYFAAGMGESGALWGEKTWNQTVEMGLESWDYAFGCEVIASVTRCCTRRHSKQSRASRLRTLSSARANSPADPDSGCAERRPPGEPA